MFRTWNPPVFPSPETSDGRGPHIFKTLVLMLYRNFNTWKLGVEHRFRHLIEEKWIPMIGDLLPVASDRILPTAESYAALLEQRYLNLLSDKELAEQLELSLPVPETNRIHPGTLEQDSGYQELNYR